ncbi:MAG: gamma-glutamyl-gamma-aminobutyrate hydrolase family protein [Chroococcidiopsidaceae cyanobacterium CP_BM_RX_35]|nr:gamma-glutamyl-gamma-aminobutyrate hydrolase family protein [Chroococcidiopsidaceae cyanobacterium CP_BM_RX_35]
MKLKPPLIGITTPLIEFTTPQERKTQLFCLRSDYVEAVRRVGGMPILLPPGEPEESALLLERVDGLVFSGGGDIDPSIYNGEAHPTIYNTDVKRDRFELALSQLALSTDVPVLGICRGLEVLVVATGGNLVPHLPDEFGEAVAHRVEQSVPSEHAVQIAPGSRLAKMIGTTETTIVSWHHQATRTVPLGWRIAAQAKDGVIEALEHKHHPWAIALQWHPELSLNDPRQQSIFRSFIAAAQDRQAALSQAAG